jgi:arylsulfatase A-like enzyme
MASRQALFDEQTIAKQLALDQAFPFLLAHTLELHEFDEEQLDVIASTYDASLRDQDAVTGELFDRLASRGILDDTIVVITSDHGEHLGEHHRIGHKYSVYNPLVRVPLVIRYPEKIEPSRVPKVVSNLHIWGTLADLTGVSLPEGVQSKSLLDLDSLPDHAVSELVRPTPQAFIRMRKVHPRFNSKPWEYTYTAVEGPDAKCIERSDGEQALYNMTADTLEEHNVASADAARTDAVCGLIAPWRASFTAYTSDGTQEPSKSKRMSAEERARLEVLGYVDEEVPSEGKDPH